LKNLDFEKRNDMERTVKVAAADGLHARPAALFVKAATEVGVPVTVRTVAGTEAPANSILAVMSLGVGCGDEVTLVSDSAEALDALEAVLLNPEL
jgi:phosphocarrier protein